MIKKKKKALTKNELVQRLRDHVRLDNVVFGTRTEAGVVGFKHYYREFANWKVIKALFTM